MHAKRIEKYVSKKRKEVKANIKDVKY